MKEKNIDLVAKISAEVTDRDLSTHALKLKDSGAQAVVMWCMPTHAALILGETAKIGFEPQERWGVFYDAGIMFAEPFVEGVRRAGKNLNTENLVTAMETLKDWKGIGGPVTYSPTEREGAKYVYYGKVRPDGTVERLTDWIRITK